MGVDFPWVICGDFNFIFLSMTKKSGPLCLDDIRHANFLLNDLFLFEPPTVGRWFTFTNGQSDLICVKLNHFLVNYDWGLCFPRVIQTCLPKLGSDHVLIHLEAGEHVSKARPFCFELA